MKCKICDCDHAIIEYQGPIRNGRLGNYTNNSVTMWKCERCNVIWHEKVITDLEEYYESKEYRNALEGSSEEKDFYRLHDKETLDKFNYTSTSIFRGKTIADIGCGCGAFLDFLKGVGKDIIAIEPSEIYRKILKSKGYHTYAYAKDAKTDWKNKIDIITSFDVIEHVKDPRIYLKEVFELLSEDGQAIIGTPTDAPIMRRLLGKIYEMKLLFSTQHLWIFSEKSLLLMAQEAGFSKIRIKYFQRYGIENLLGWLREKEAQADIDDSCVTGAVNNVWKEECSREKSSDYIVLYLDK